MKHQIHGVVSLFTLVTAVCIAAWTAFNVSYAQGIVYASGGFFSLLLILHSFCAKCEARDSCSHLIPGKIVSLFPARSSSKYDKLDLISTAMALIILLIFPLAWLWLFRTWLIVYVVLVLVAVTQIRTRLCRNCENRLCPANKKRRAAKLPFDSSIFR